MDLPELLNMGHLLLLQQLQLLLELPQAFVLILNRVNLMEEAEAKFLQGNCLGPVRQLLQS